MLLHKSARCALQSLDSRSDRPSGEPAVHGTVAQQARSRHSLVKDPLNEDREHAGERLAERRCSLKVFLRRCDVGLVVRLKRRSEDGFLLAERPAQSRFGDPTLSSTLIQGRPSLPVMAERAHDRWHCGVKIYGSRSPSWHFVPASQRIIPPCGRVPRTRPTGYEIKPKVRRALTERTSPWRLRAREYEPVAPAKSTRSTRRARGSLSARRSLPCSPCLELPEASANSSGSASRV
ncbi:MAG: hypothetical protein ACI8XD_000922 [Thermoproteota archaeon]|jgi:hypothetical protein